MHCTGLWRCVCLSTDYRGQGILQIKFIAWTFICQESHNLIPICGPMANLLCHGKAKTFPFKKTHFWKLSAALGGCSSFFGAAGLLTKHTYLICYTQVFLAALLCTFTCRCWRVWEQGGRPDHWGAVKRHAFCKLLPSVSQALWASIHIHESYGTHPGSAKKWLACNP